MRGDVQVEPLRRAVELDALRRSGWVNIDDRWDLRHFDSSDEFMNRAWAEARAAGEAERFEAREALDLVITVMGLREAYPNREDHSGYSLEGQRVGANRLWADLKAARGHVKGSEALARIQAAMGKGNERGRS